MSTNNMILGGAAVVLILVAGWWLMNREAAPEGADMNSSEAGETISAGDISAPSTIPSNGEAVSVANQMASETVAVSSVTFSQPGWVAVRDNEGWTLGAGRFAAGTHTNVSVKLLRGTTAGERYQVLLYIDDGDGAFDLKSEILVTRPDGSVVGTMFTAQ